MTRFLPLLALFATPLHAQFYDAVVAPDGTGDFLTIQDAILSIRDYRPEGRSRIFVRKGTYEEKVVVPSYKTQISLIGEDRDSCILVYHDHANLQGTGHFEGVVLGTKADKMGRNKQNDTLGQRRGHRLGTFESYTLLALGRGFECENMTIANDAMTHYNPEWWQTRENKAGVGQAVALHNESDGSVFRNCRLLGFQDTVFNGGEGTRQLFDHCYIEGTVDYLFGPATVWIEQCELHSLTNGYVTAASTPADVAYGYVFHACTFTADAAASGVYLGRPWRNYAAVTLLDCNLTRTIRPEGWHNWNDPRRELTARYAEWNSTGEGSATSQRAAFSHQLTQDEAARYTLANVMKQPASSWQPAASSVLFGDVVQPFLQTATPYVAGTLETTPVPAEPDKFVEPLVVNLKAVDCTTFVEYVTAARLARTATPSETDVTFCQYLTALRYRHGKRGNYATRKHYFSEWITDGEQQGFFKEITASLPGAQRRALSLNYMSTHPAAYPMLAASPALLTAVADTEKTLSSGTVAYIPTAQIAKASASLQHGDLVAFVTDLKGLDIQHVGFVYKNEGDDTPHLLHASSTQKRVTLDSRSLAAYAASLKHCIGIRVIRLTSR